MIWNSAPTHQNDKIFELLMINSVNNNRYVKGGKHVAAVVYKKTVLSIGHSNQKTHPIEKKYQRCLGADYLHAEKDAIIKAINRYNYEVLKKCSLYVIKVSRSGNIGLSKPCSSCQAFIDAVGIKKVYWS
jgi:deoxycytidylate deaminase